ncbi:MAG: DUF3772 domain-containing protein, partial [Pseudomonadota bacterium]
MMRLIFASIFVFCATFVLAQTPGTGPDYEAWNRLASSIETTLEQSTPSEVYLTQQRANVASQRTIFTQAQEVNANRLATLREQIVALGIPPEDGSTESADITARRDELQAQFDALSAPRLRAIEAFTRADGIITEIDTQLDALSADRLLTLGPSPLNPGAWPLAFQAIGNSIANAWDGIRISLTLQRQLDQTRDQLPLILLLGVVGVLLITQARKRVAQATGWMEARETDASHGLAAFVVSLGQILLPFVGILVLLQAASLTGLYGTRIEALLDRMPLIGFVVLAARWIGNRTFNLDDPGSALMVLDDKDHRAGRRMTTLLSVLFGVMLTVNVLAVHDDYSAEIIAVLTFVFVVSAAAVTLRLCQLLLRAHRGALRLASDASEPAKPSGFALKKRLAQVGFVISIISVLAAVIGYSAAANALVFPFIYTLAVIATLALVFEAVRDFCAWV